MFRSVSGKEFPCTRSILTRDSEFADLSAAGVPRAVLYRISTCNGEAPMAIVLDGSSLTIEKLVRIARHGESVALSSAATGRISDCRTMLEEKIRAREIMYGINTGIGEFSEMVLNDDQVQQFQRYLIYNHAAGIGEPFPDEVVRAAMVSRANVHARGHSGCRLEIPQTFVEMINKGVTPIVCRKGSVGASGDLAPMAQIALLLMGEG